MSKQLVLTTDTIGEGALLFHVSVSGTDWDCPAMWLVRANDWDAALSTAKAQYNECDDVTTWDGYEIGAFA